MHQNPTIAIAATALAISSRGGTMLFVISVILPFPACGGMHFLDKLTCNLGKSFQAEHPNDDSQYLLRLLKTGACPASLALSSPNF